jgi:cytochrome P450
MRRRDLPPGPSSPALYQSVGLWTRPLAYPERLRARYGKRFTVRFFGSPPFVILADPEEIKEVFTAPPDILHPGEGARVLEPVVGSNSVILLDEDPHLEQRKLMLPAFHGEKMERLSGLMAEVAEREVASWPRNERIELHPRMQRLTMEIILRAVFGLDPGERLDALRDRLSTMLAFGDRPISLVRFPERLEPVLERIGPFAEFVRLQQGADGLIFELIDERRREHGERDDVLSMMLEARHDDGSPMSDQELRDELMTMLVAGHETTASSLAWAFERITRAPRVLARLSEEIASGDGKEYVTATIQETLRRRPVLPNVEPRLVKSEYEIGGWTYPPGVCLVPNAYLVHHDPEIYPEPYEFRPERFLEEPPGTYTWIPFGGGRRRCLGASFAMVEMEIVLRSVINGGAVLPTTEAHEAPGRRNITVTPSGRSRVTLGKRRNGAGSGTEVAAATAAD